jgi:hypothetical protein
MPHPAANTAQALQSPPMRQNTQSKWPHQLEPIGEPTVKSPVTLTAHFRVIHETEHSDTQAAGRTPIELLRPGDRRACGKVTGNTGSTT